MDHPARFAWLFGTEAIPRESPSESEIHAAWGVSQRVTQVVAVTGPRLLGWAGRGAAPIAEDVGDFVVAARTFAWIQRTFCARLARELDAAGIDYVFLKGAAAAVYYEDALHRQGGDVDLGVDSADLGHATDVLLRLAMRPGEWIETSAAYVTGNPIRRRLEEQSHHYEVGMFVKAVRPAGLPPEMEASIRRACCNRECIGWFVGEEGELGCYLNVDLHFGLTGAVKSRQVLDTRQTMRGLAIPSPSWTLFHAISKIYWEGATCYGEGLHHYADLIRILRTCTDTEAERVATLLRDDDLCVGAHYVLRRVEPAFGQALPEALRRLVSEFAVPPMWGDAREHHDHGDVWNKLWGRR